MKFTLPHLQKFLYRPLYLIYQESVPLHWFSSVTFIQEAAQLWSSVLFYLYLIIGNFSLLSRVNFPRKNLNHGELRWTICQISSILCSPIFPQTSGSKDLDSSATINEWCLEPVTQEIFLLSFLSVNPCQEILKLWLMKWIWASSTANLFFSLLPRFTVSSRILQKHRLRLWPSGVCGRLWSRG